MDHREEVLALQAWLGTQILGQNQLVSRLLIALLADGHLLVEGAPGLAKTKAIKTLATGLEGEFHRIQFTPDLLPSDVTGTEIYHADDGTFRFQQGPIFHNLILADEINRAPAKVQSALLEAMAERQVSFGRETFPLPPLFLVMATQNPIEQEGTYPLPEAQVDRFAMKLIFELGDGEEELDIIKLKHGGMKSKIRPVTTAATVNKMIAVVKRKIHISEGMMGYLRDVIMKTRTDPRLMLGCSPRATIAILQNSKAYAAMNGRGYVIPDDTKRILTNSIAHRLQLKAEAELEGTTGQIVIEDIANQITVPV